MTNIWMTDPESEDYLKNTLIIISLMSLAISTCTHKEDTSKKVSNMETIVVNLNTNEYDVYIGRGIKKRTNMLTKGIKPGEEGWLGNPHPIGYCQICSTTHTREECIEKFKEDFYKKLDRDPEFRKAVLALKGKRLGCYCKPKPCHGDVIKAWVDSQ